MDQEANAGHHREHGQRQTIQHQTKADVEVANRHPRPQWLGKTLMTVIDEIQSDNRRYQCR